MGMVRAYALDAELGTQLDELLKQAVTGAHPTPGHSALLTVAHITHKAGACHPVPLVGTARPAHARTLLSNTGPACMCTGTK